jgi:endonuclease/exonuclease/phosphatase family metal-dependent hydrolase
MAESLRLMTYNIHACVGTDGRLDLERVAAVIEREAPDVVALQEVDVGRKRSFYRDQASALSRLLDTDAHFTRATSDADGHYGIALLTRHDVTIRAEGSLPARRDEVRAAQWAELVVRGHAIELLHSHLSVHFLDRRLQIGTLLGGEWLERHLTHPRLVFCGDLNAAPGSHVYRQLARRLCDVRLGVGGSRLRGATWPSRFPLFRLDHIFVGSGFRVDRTSVPRDALTMRASDHLPLVADLVLLS